MKTIRWDTGKMEFVINREGNNYDKCTIIEKYRINEFINAERTV